MGDGIKKFQAVGQKIKEEVEEKNKQTAIERKEALNALDVLRGNEELAKLYQENAQVGAENLAGELPLLKVHAVGRSTENELADGTEPKDGWFFYKPTAEQYETIQCHILTISKGFRAEGLAQGNGKARDVFNQIVGGVIIDGSDYKPFIMYFTGLKLSPLWEFGKEAAKYTRARPVSLPMFTLTVKLSTSKVKNSFGASWVVNFEILKDEGGYPRIILDEGKFQFLKDNVAMMEETIASLIAKKITKETAEAEPIPLKTEEETMYDSDGVPL